MAAERSLFEDPLEADTPSVAWNEPIDLSHEREIRASRQVRDRSGFYPRLGKRILDLGLGLPLSLVATPIILGLAGLVIITAGRPAFYQAKRVGKDGREFRMWKLRTMVPDAELMLEKWLAEDEGLAQEYGQSFKLKHDPRITPFGRFLRRSSLDELPQLWHVLSGDMSLVGPRPYYTWELESLPDVRRDVISVSPGLTGPWQVSGRNDIAPPDRMQLDRAYTRDYSFKGDMGYLAQTILPLLKRNGC